MPDRATVLLVESDAEERERLGAALEDVGSEVIACPGPSGPAYTCVGSRQGSCPLVEHADVVVLDTSLASDEAGIGTSSDELLELYAASGRTVVALGPGGWLRSPFAVGHVVHLDERPATGDAVAAVHTAPPADGFVLRGKRAG